MQADSSPSVLILWATPSSPNLGVRVLADGMAALARSAFGVDTTIGFQDVYPERNRPGFSGRTLARDLGRLNGPIKERIRDFDIVLDSGAGDSFADIYGLKRLLTFAYVQRATRHVGRPTPLVLGPQTIGPFNTWAGRVVARASLRHAELAMVRDPLSAQHMRELGRAVDCEATDVVFQLPRPARRNELDAVVNVSGLLWQPNSHVDHMAYRRSVIDLCRGLVGVGRSVTLLPHVLDNPSPDNDLPAIRHVNEALAGTVSVLVPTDLAEVRKMLASARVVVGSRMHACLNALSVGTPAISWAYSRKFEPLMASIGWPHSIDLRTEPDPATKTLALIAASDEEVTRKLIARSIADASIRLQRASRALSTVVGGRQ